MSTTNSAGVPFSPSRLLIVAGNTFLEAVRQKLFNFLLLTQHGFLRQVPPTEDNPVEVICRTVAAAMSDGEIPSGNPTLIAGAIIGIIVQPATFKLYGRLTQGLGELADEIVALCLKVVS